MKLFKIIALACGAILIIAVGYAIYSFRSQLLDHETAEYKSRIEYIWQGNMPYQPSALEKARLDASKNFIIKLLQRNNLPSNKPYLVSFPLATQTLRSAIIIAPGGAYMLRAEKHEGVEIAHWLNSIGVAAFVLN